MHPIPFEKYQGLGNDFVVFKWADVQKLDLGALARTVCHRKRGVGADGMMVLKCDPVTMLFYNADGSRAPMCGNGIRCLAQFAKQNGCVHSDDFVIETDSGSRRVKWLSEDTVSVDMGTPIWTPSAIPSTHAAPTFIDCPLSVAGESIRLTALFMGTAHSVVFVDAHDTAYIKTVGAAVEHHPLFPERINVNFVKVVNAHTLDVVTYERGVGITDACGTGACASAVVAYKLGYSAGAVTVTMPGGDLAIQLTPTGVTITGTAHRVFDGYYRY